MSNIFIKPSEGITVPLREHPTDRPLPAAGDWRPQSQFWLRRLRDKDVIEATPPEATGGSGATDPVVTELLAGTVDQVQAGLSELTAEALQKALAAEQAGQQRKGVITAVQAEITARAGGNK